MQKVQFMAVIQGGLSYQDWLTAVAVLGMSGQPWTIGPTYRLPDLCLSLSSQPLDPARGYMHCLLRLTISKPPRLIILYN